MSDIALAVAGARRAPASTHVVGAIARREIGLASRRRLVRLLFLGSLLPPLIFTVILVVKMIAEQTTGMDLGWDPLLRFLQFQALPVALLSLGLGTPSVARDRSEEVLFLYATRPVLPWHYALGKMLAVALPAAGLMLLPGLLIAVLRYGVTADITLEDAVMMVLKVALASIVLAWGYAGISVGPSAIARKARWALLLALGFFFLPDAIAGNIADDPLPVGPASSIAHLLETLFDHGDVFYGVFGAFILLALGVFGMWVTTARVRQEMIP